MKVLVSTVPQAGHFHPLIPLAAALRDRGHAVTFAVSPDYARRARDAGFSAYDVGDEFGDWFADLAQRHGGEPGAGLAPEEIEGWFTPRLFGEVGIAHTLDGLCAAIDGVEPDLVIHDNYQFAAPLAAAIAGVPHVAHGLGPLPPPDVFAATAQHVAGQWSAHGLAVPEFAGALEGTVVTISPPSLDIGLPDSSARHVLRIRPVGYDAIGTAPPPPWLAALPDRPVVYATLGTMFNSARDVFRAILDGLADTDVSVVMTIGRDRSVDWLGAVPANAHVEPYIPQSLVLDRCAAVVSHGGSGTILPPLGRGLPQVLVPQGADNFTNAARCAHAGAGVVLLPGQVSPERVREAVRRALDEPAIGAAARAIAAEIAALPTPDDMAALLET